jgi:hypothetical protein
MNWINGIGVRPEAVSLTPQGRKAVVTGVTYLGSFCQIEMTLETGEMIHAQAAPGACLPPGQTVYVTWNTDDEIRL